MITLNTQERSKTDNLEKIRKDELIPAVVYGVGVENTLISVPAKEFKKIYKEVGETSTITLTLKGKIVSVLVHDMQLDPVKGNVIHLDFLAVDLKKKITANVPIEFTGVSAIVKSGQGILVKVLHEVEVSALPADMPHSLVADISKLETLDDNVFAVDIVLPKNIELLTGLEEVVAAVTATHEEVETAPVDLASIEVEKKGKKDEETA